MSIVVKNSRGGSCVKKKMAGGSRESKVDKGKY